MKRLEDSILVRRLHLHNLIVVYVCRNPRDACVSYYHHQRLWDEGYRFKGSFEDFAKLFRKGILSYGSYWSHLKVGLIPHANCIES